MRFTNYELRIVNCELYMMMTLNGVSLGMRICAFYFSPVSEVINEIQKFEKTIQAEIEKGRE